MTTSKEERMRILEKVERGELSTDEAIGTLGEEKSNHADVMDPLPSTPMEVLEALEAGKISPDEAADRLGSQKDNAFPGREDGEMLSDINEIPIKKRGFWLFPLWGGVGLILLSAAWMASRLQNASYDFWFFVAWLPLALGVLLISLAWASRNSPWLKLNMRSRSAGRFRRLNFNFPLPTGLLNWTINVFGHKIGSEELGKLKNMLATNGPLKDPIVVHLSDDDDEDEIEVIIA